MAKNTPRKLFSFFRFKFFTFQREKKVDQIFAQMNKRRDNGFPFRTFEQMNAQTRKMDIRALIDLIDAQSHEMGEAYGEAYRYILRREIYERLELYLRQIQMHIPQKSRLETFAS